MSDVTCPYCHHEQEINHDDGYGYEESVLHEQDCENCGKPFKFSTTLMFHYDVFCQDGDHVMEQSPVAGCESLWECANCEYFETREPRQPKGSDDGA